MPIAFRTPSLRNVVRTAPYGHSGAYATLEGVIRHHLDPVAGWQGYDPSQAVLPDLSGSPAVPGLDAPGGRPPEPSPLLAGVTLSDAEIADLITFLHALTDGQSLDRPSGRAGKRAKRAAGASYRGAMSVTHCALVSCQGH
jgi:cytochrome c peroxidase